MKHRSAPRPTPSTARNDATPPRQGEFHQGQAHVSNPAAVERGADDAAAGRAGKPAPEGNTPGGISS